MRRFAASFVICSTLLLGSSAGQAFGEDYYCPPGAKFCPAPGSGQAAAPSADAPFGLDGAGSFGNDQYAMYAGQLNEGEKLIMVAPSVDMSAYGMSPASPSYASAPASSGGMDMDFMPPPPGSPRPASASSSSFGGNAMAYAPQPSAPTYQSAPAPMYEAPSYYDTPSYASAAGEETLYQPIQNIQPAPAYQEAPAAVRTEDIETRMASVAPIRRAPRESVKVSGPTPAARVEPSDSPLAPSPKSFAQSRQEVTGSWDDDDEIETRRKPDRDAVAQKPAKKKRADMLSEVANETSRKSDKSKDRDEPKKKNKKKAKADKKGKASSDDRVPWWKGGMWRNRNR